MSLPVTWMLSWTCHQAFQEDLCLVAGLCPLLWCLWSRHVPPVLGCADTVLTQTTACAAGPGPRGTHGSRSVSGARLRDERWVWKLPERLAVARPSVTLALWALAVYSATSELPPKGQSCLNFRLTFSSTIALTSPFISFFSC